jgi:hypothetical protein
MQVVCWLGLLSLGLFPGDAGGSAEEVALASSPWLSDHENYVRTSQVAHATNTDAWLDMMSAYTTGVQLKSVPRYNFIMGFPHGQHEVKVVFAPTGFSYSPAFSEVLLESLKVRTSDVSPLEKGRLLARLVRPSMTASEIHALFGKSKGFLRNYSETGCRLVFCDYGVTVLWSFSKGFFVEQKVARSGDGPMQVWDWFEVWREEKRAACRRPGGWPPPDYRGY